MAISCDLPSIISSPRLRGTAILLPPLAAICYLAYGSIPDYLYVAVGAAVAAIAYFAPFRRFDEQVELFWDLTGYAFTIAFLRLLDFLLAGPTGAAAGLSLFKHAREYTADTSAWILIPLAVVVSDYLNYWSHRLLHSRRLWSSHAWHHSPHYLNWLAGSRGTLIHHLFLGLPYVFVALFFPPPNSETALIAGLLLGVLNQHITHTNLRVPFARQLEMAVVTPRVHFVHHCARMRYTNSNYGSLFTVWDRLHGTFTDPDSVPPDEPLGLDYEIDNWRLIAGLPRKA